MNMRKQFNHYIQNLQDEITTQFEKIDGQAQFKEETWERSGGGGGRTRVIENGAVFEKGGVNTSSVHGELPQVLQQRLGVTTGNFSASGLSLVMHPKNPFIPTVHANWRYFELYNNEGEVIDQWFGGGQDLTPYYFFEEDAIHFHQVCKKACDRHDPEFYQDYKKHCDEYFYNTHREEARGIGGLFFDYLRPTQKYSLITWYDFVTDVGNSFLEAYLPIVQKRKDTPFNAAQRNWQEIRRGRYVEFNLVHDRGTLFGLKTQGRIESILMSLPPHVQWVYDYHPKKNSAEAQLEEILKNPREWV